MIPVASVALMTALALVFAMAVMAHVAATLIVSVAYMIGVILVIRMILMGCKCFSASLAVVPSMRLVTAVLVVSVLLAHHRLPHRTLRSVCLSQPYTP